MLFNKSPLVEGSFLLPNQKELPVRQDFVVPWFEVQGGALSNSHLVFIEEFGVGS